jgi:hypothetical protein
VSADGVSTVLLTVFEFFHVDATGALELVWIRHTT